MLKFYVILSFVLSVIIILLAIKTFNQNEKIYEMEQIIKYTVKPTNFTISQKNIIGYVEKKQDNELRLYISDREHIQNLKTDNISMRKYKIEKYCKDLIELGITKYI